MGSETSNKYSTIKSTARAESREGSAPPVHGICSEKLDALAKKIDEIAERKKRNIWRRIIGPGIHERS